MQKKSVIILLTALCNFFIATANAESFTFAALGDAPYGPDETAGVNYRKLIGEINLIKPAFSIHVGDFKEGKAVCSDAEFALQRKNFDLFSQALIYTPGDNDWTDCNRVSNGSYDPLSRLDKLRVLFFKPDQSLGQTPLALVSQSIVMSAYSEFVENQRWQQSHTLFATLHIVGSNNRFDPFDPRAQSELQKRDQANIAWINDAFKIAKEKNLGAIVFAFQADVFLKKLNNNNIDFDQGYEATIKQTLLPEAAKFKKPILIIHGDSHTFKFDQKFSALDPALENVYRLQVPGAKIIDAVLVTVDEKATPPFKVKMVRTP